MKTQIIVIILLFYTCSAFAWQENSNWYLNAQHLLNLSNNPPTVDFYDSYSINQGYNVSVSDNLGNLLFTSSGDSLTNANGLITPNGNNLDNAFINEFSPTSFSFQPVTAVQFPTEPHRYYLFVLANGMYGFSDSGFEYIPGILQYSVVDMSLDAGKGDIADEEKNILLGENLTGAMTAVSGECGTVWLLTHVYDSNQFTAWKISETGIGNPIGSNAGLSVSNVYSAGEQYDNLNGIFASPDGKKIAFFFRNELQLFDFDNLNGIVSNPVTLPSAPETISGTFSPQGDYFYTSEPESNNITKIYRFDLTSTDAAVIQNSKTLIATFGKDGHLSLLQRAPNGSIYGTIGRYLYEIKNPDAVEPEDVVIPEEPVLEDTDETAFIYNLPNLLTNPCTEVSVTDTKRKFVPKVFPNPFVNYVAIDNKEGFLGEAHFFLFNAAGKLLLSHPLLSEADNYQIDIPDYFPSGLYFYKIESQTGVFSRKISK